MNIIQIYLLISLVTGLFIKRRGLSCGLTAYCGKYPADKNALKIIALYNEERGRDSCGIFHNGRVTKGWQNNSPKISDLFKSEDIEIDPEWRNVVIHTRKSTVGSHSEINCHPYEYEIKQGDKTSHKMWLAQNGTVHNMTELCKEVGLDYKDYSTDTMGIGAIIAKTRSFNVFSKYQGAGAFICWDSKNLNTMWVFKGAAGKIEERPLFYLVDEERQGFYISSLKEPLEIISSGIGEIESFQGNVLYKIVDGVIQELYPIERDYKLSPTYVPPKPTFIDALPEKARNFFRKNGVFGNRIYWKEGRFWRAGNLLSGEVELSDETGCFFSKKNKNKRVKETYSTYYFFNGIMFKNQKCYNEFLEKHNGNYAVYAYELRELIAFPFPISKVNYSLPNNQRYPNYIYFKNTTECENTWQINKDMPFVNSKYLKIPFTEDSPKYLVFKLGAYVTNNYSKELENIISENEFLKIKEINEANKEQLRLPLTSISKDTPSQPKEASTSGVDKVHENKNWDSHDIPEYFNSFPEYPDEDVHDQALFNDSLEDEINLLKMDFVQFIEEFGLNIGSLQSENDELKDAKVQKCLDLLSKLQTSFVNSIPFMDLIQELSNEEQKGKNN